MQSRLWFEHYVGVYIKELHRAFMDEEIGIISGTYIH